MSATEDFLAEMQRRRKQQLEQIQRLFQNQATEAPSQMAPAQSSPSKVIGMAKGGMPSSMVPSGGGGAGGQAPTLGGVLGAGGGTGPGGYLGPTVVGGGGFAGGTGIGTGAGAGIMNATQGPILAGMAGQAAAGAAPAAASATPGILSQLGTGISAAAGAAGGGIASLISYLFSSRRLKHEIETFQQIKDLRWVTFKYLPELDPDQTRLLGLIAEEVYETRPEIVVLDEMGEPLAIQYGLIPDEDWPAVMELNPVTQTWR